MKFSERIGKKSPRSSFQIDSIDTELKNSIWNIVDLFFIKSLKESHNYLDWSKFKAVIQSIWFSHFKLPLDTIPKQTSIIASEFRRLFFQKWDYLEIYDFIDFLASQELPFDKEAFINSLNSVLKREMSGYRFVNNVLSPIIDEKQISEIENALIKTEDKFKAVNIHINEALNKLSDRQFPDYRNSVKESISSIESLCQVILNDNKAELGKALKLLKDKIKIHTALEQGFIKIYGYTSDSDGIRHGLQGEPILDQEDAIFMLVSCSAFVNYLIAKSIKAGVV